MKNLVLTLVMLFAFFGMAQSAQAVCYVSGYVQDFGTGNPVSGATITLYGNNGAVDSATTGSNGHYLLATRSAGSYLVQGVSSRAVYFNDGAWYDSAAQVYCNWNGNHTVNFIETGGPGVVNGAVAKNGLSAVGRTVTATFDVPGYGTYVYSTTTDSNGLYSFTNLPCVRNYVITVVPTSGETVVALNGSGSVYTTFCSASNIDHSFVIQ